MIVELSKLESLIVDAHHALPEDCRSAPASPEELAAFESQFGTIPSSFRWYLEHCGGGVVGPEWVNDIRKLPESHRKFRDEFGEGGGWTMTGVFVIGWDGAGNPFGVNEATGEVVIEDHNFGGIHVLAPSLLQFLAEGLGIAKRG